ncbi:hypothetical protein ABW20_dc0107638 [Dactylellina cionopaga]|nr:hypothetical protein ABW20_dc0107638 [Dactylellina cionopaga]
MPQRGRKQQSITNLVVDPDTLGEDSQDDDFDPRASHGSPPKRHSRPPRKGRSTSKKLSKPRRKREEYEDDEGDDLSRGSWSQSPISEEDEDDLEMNAAGRPARRAVKNSKVQYRESSGSEVPELPSDRDEDDEDEAVFTEEEDVKPKSRKAKAGKTPQKQAPKKAPASSTRRSRRTTVPDEDEDELSVPATDDEGEQQKQPPPKSLIIKLRVPKKKYEEEMARKGSGSSASNPGPPTQRRSSRLASLPPENTAEDLPTRTRGKSREPTQSPTGRNRRSRSTSRPTTGNKGPARPPPTRRMTRAASRASSEGAASAEEHEEHEDNMEVEEPVPAALAMSRITEESTQTSSNKLTNGNASGPVTAAAVNKDGAFQPGMTSTDTGDSLEVNVTQRELSGLLVAPDLIEDDEPAGRKPTRASVALKKEAVEMGIFAEDEDEEDAQVRGDIVDINMEDDDDDDEPVPTGRRTRSSAKRNVTPPSNFTTPKKPQSQRKTKRSSKDSDDEYEEEGEEHEDHDDSDVDHPEPDDDDDGYDDERDESRGRRTRAASQKKRRRSQMSTDPVDLDMDELAEEARDLGKERKRTRRENRFLMAVEEDSSSGRRPRRAAEKVVDYRVFRPEENLIIEDDGTPPPTIIGKRNGRKGGSSGARPLFNTLGIFGGIGQERSIFNSDRNLGFNDSDSSDDDIQMMPAGGTDAIVPPVSTGGKRDSISRAGAHGTPMDMGKITSATKQSLADADPIGIDPNVDFSKVGGLAEHINQLKEMVALPLMYPEIFQNLGITPPRGVLFHGPPGTGKTLLARALANSCSANGKQITFYMRKGADILSKWVGEAERQVRLLFADARKNAPSIIFFDEIDGLAPVRSSKQDQIHASIVSTLLALMDGMDGRGQVIVIGATNRPDSIDPALRRPGRFDREFYFPLPDKTSRRAIIEIHTSNWTPPLSDNFKDELANVTKGYGGADLRALCTEAALNAVQRKYPQIYKDTDKKFLIDPKSIEVTARDFMISVDKIVPSSERSSTSGAAPLPEHIAPLLTPTLEAIKQKLKQVFPEKKSQSALQEAEYEPYTDADGGFGREKMLKDFEVTRVFKPRILIHGQQGMGQGYLGAALLHQFEGIHVQTVNLPILMGDPAKNAEATLIQLFTELRRHKPSVLYIPDLENWFSAVSNDVLMTFMHLVQSIGSSERILLLGMTSAEIEDVDAIIIRDLFGYSRKGRIGILRPDEAQRDQFFQRVISFIRKSPKEFPDPTMRPKRKIETLPLAPPPPPKVLSKEEIRQQRHNDKYYIHQLKVRLMPIIEMLKAKYKRFKRSVIPPERLQQLDFPPVNDGEVVVSDIRPQPDVRTAKDDSGVDMILDIPRDKKFYNLDLEVIEERVFNGYYVKPSQFVDDISYLMADSQSNGDRQAIMQAGEMMTNVEISIFEMERDNAALTSELRAVWDRVQERLKQRKSGGSRPGGLPTITESGEGSTRAEASQTQMTPLVPSTGITTRTYTMGTPAMLYQQAQMQMPPPLIEERDADSLNGYNASSELGPKDSDGDAVMSDIPAVGGSQQQPPSIPPQSDSNQSSTFRTAAQSMVPQQSADPQIPSPQPQPPASTSTGGGVAVTQISGIINSTTANTQKSALGRAGNSAPVGLSSTQTQFEQNTMNVSSTTSGKDNSNRLSLQTSSSNQTNVPQDTPPARPYTYASESGGSGNSSAMRANQLLAHASTTTGFEYPIAFGDSQLPDTQPVASSEGSAPSQFALLGQDFRSTQATGGYSSGSQQSPFVPSHLRHIANLPGPSPTSSAPPILRRAATPEIPDPPLQLDEEELLAFHRLLVDISGGFTIEQLEQVNAAVMDLVWQFRGSWDRNEILREGKEIVREVQDDIMEMERLMKARKGKLRAREEEEISYGDVLTSEVD